MRWSRPISMTIKGNLSFFFCYSASKTHLEDGWNAKQKTYISFEFPTYSFFIQWPDEQLIIAVKYQKSLPKTDLFREPKHVFSFL